MINTTGETEMIKTEKNTLSELKKLSTTSCAFEEADAEQSSMLDEILMRG